MNKRTITRLTAGFLAVGMISSGRALAQAPEQTPAPPPAHESAPPPPPQTPAPAPAQESAQAPAPPSALSATPYQPKFPGDPARSESEAQALGYMRVVLRAQKEYKKRHDKYAQTLMELAGTGSLTKRMARTTERGDYTVGFKTEKDGYILTMTPKQMDSEHRSFYAEEDGVIHADDQKPADLTSPKVK